jgi:outer membrane protein assembly factor BamB
MRTARWFALTVLSAATACNCGHKGSGGSIVSEDSTPDATPNPLNFGSVPIGGSEILPLKLTDLGELALDITSATIVQGPGTAVGTFAFAPLTNLNTPFGASVQPGADASANIEFKPTAGGAQTATLVIKSNSNATPTYNVTLEGNGVNVSIVVQPSSLDFGNVQDGTTAKLTVTLTNEGTSTSDPITVSPVAGTQAADFAWTGTPIALAPGASFTLAVTFSPVQPGQASALIPYQYCTSCSPSNIPLTGVGVDCQLVYNPNPIAFSNVPIGSTVTSGTVTLLDIGAAACQITSLALDMPSSVYTLTGVAATPIVLQPLGSTTFGVSYTAATTTDPPNAVDALYVPLDAAGTAVTGVSPRPSSDPINGNGTINPCSLTVSPPSYNFGNVTVGTAVQKSVTVTNNGGEQCSISGIAFAAGTDPAYSLVNAAQTSFTLAAGQNQAIAVSCDVATSGTPLLRRGALTFASTDPNQPNVSVPLTAYLQGTGPYSNGWPKWHNDNTDQGISQSDTTGNVGTVLWEFRVGVPQSAGGLGGSVNPNPTYMNSPVVDASGNVYQLAMDGTFYGVNPGGTELWTPPTLLPPNPDEHPATPIIAADGTIYIETGTDGASLTSAAQLYHIDAATGAILFQAGPPTGTSSYGGESSGADGFDVNPSIGNDGLLFDGDDFGQTVTYTLNSGGSFTQTNEVILQFYGERVAVAIDANNNSYWCSLNVCFGVSAPASGFTQIAGWTGGQTGAPIGSAPGGGTTWVNSDLAYDENNTGWLMVEAGMQTGSTGSTEVVAMDTGTGKPHWDTKLPSGPTPGSWNLLTEDGIFSSDVGNSSPAIDDTNGANGTNGTVYVGNVDGLYALNAKSGAIIWSYKPSQDTGAKADVDTAPAIGGDGTIFFGTAGGTFYAVNPDGTERFHYTTGGRISSSPAIGPDGTVFIVSDDGQMYAIR